MAPTFDEYWKIQDPHEDTTSAHFLRLRIVVGAEKQHFENELSPRRCGEERRTMYIHPR
jgi:hypothetical protein